MLRLLVWYSPARSSLQTIGNYAFNSAQFTGAFPALTSLQTIGYSAFSGYDLGSTFTGESLVTNYRRFCVF